MSNATLAQRFDELNAEIPGYLANQHADLIEKAEALRAEFTVSVPGAVEDDDTEKAMTDLGARINSFIGLCEGQRKVNKDIPAKSPKLIDDFYKGLTSELGRGLEALRARVNFYKDKKRIAEQRRKDEEAARAREAERQAAIAREEAARAERERLEAEERARAESDPDARRAAEEDADRLAQERREREDEARRKAQEAATAQAAARATTPMVKTESGAKSGQTGRWGAKVEDRAALMASLGPLGPYFTIAAIESAANGYARHLKDAAVCPGLRFVEEFNTQFRGG